MSSDLLVEICRRDALFWAKIPTLAGTPSVPPLLIMIPSILSSRFSNPSLLLLLFTFIPLCWPLLFFTFPLIFYFIVSDKFLLQPSSIHTNKNILRSMKLFQKCTAQRSRSKSTASTFSKGAPPSPLRPSITRNPMIVAHRAGGGSAPENTLAACRQTLSQTPPSTILHLDLHLTSDGEVICFHDQEPHERNMLKLTGVDKSVRHLNYSELPCLSPRIPTNPLCDLGTYVDTTQFDKKGGRTGEGRRICKFGEWPQARCERPKARYERPKACYERPKTRYERLTTPICGSRRVDRSSLKAALRRELREVRCPACASPSAAPNALPQATRDKRCYQRAAR